MFGRKGLKSGTGGGASQAGPGPSPAPTASRSPSFPASDVPPIIVEAMHWVYFVTAGESITPEQSFPNFSASGLSICFMGADRVSGRSMELSTAEGRAIGYVFPEFASVMMWGQTQPRAAIPLNVIDERFPGFEAEVKKILV